MSLYSVPSSTHSWPSTRSNTLRTGSTCQRRRRDEAAARTRQRWPALLGGGAQQWRGHHQPLVVQLRKLAVRQLRGHDEARVLELLVSHRSSLRDAAASHVARVLERRARERLLWLLHGLPGRNTASNTRAQIRHADTPTCRATRALAASRWLSRLFSSLTSLSPSLDGAYNM